MWTGSHVVTLGAICLRALNSFVNIRSNNRILDACSNEVQSKRKEESFASVQRATGEKRRMLHAFVEL